MQAILSVWGLTSAVNTATGVQQPKLFCYHINSAFLAFNPLLLPESDQYLLNFCEETISWLLKSRQRFEFSTFLLSDHFCNIGHSRQTIRRNRKNCIILTSLVTCKYNMTSCLHWENCLHFVYAPRCMSFLSHTQMH